jgi:hypothetical protein
MAMVQQMRPAGSPVPGVKLGDIFYDEFFEYIMTVTFAGSDNLQRVIPIQADAHFVWVSAYFNSSGQSGVGWQGSGLNRGGSVVQITDGGTQRALSSAQVPVNTLFGSAQRPFVLPLRKMFRANTSINLSLTDTTAAAQTVDYVFGGFKIPLSHAAQLGIV